MSLVRFRSEAPSAALAHLVERHLAKVEVASSSLVSRSKSNSAAFHGGGICIWCRSQVVRQRSAKPLCTSSNLVGTSKQSGCFAKRPLFFLPGPACRANRPRSAMALAPARGQGAKCKRAPRRLPGMSTPNSSPGAARRAGRPLPRGRRGPFFAARVFVAKEFENIRAFVYNKPERKQSKATGKRR